MRIHIRTHTCIYTETCGLPIEISLFSMAMASKHITYKIFVETSFITEGSEYFF